MININQLKPIPSDEFNVPINDHVYGFKFINCGNFTAYDLTIDDELIISGFRALFAQPLITYPHLEVDGNFIFDTNGIDPIYTEFGTTQFLKYLTPDETISWRKLLSTGSYD